MRKSGSKLLNSIFIKGEGPSKGFFGRPIEEIKKEFPLLMQIKEENETLAGIAWLMSEAVKPHADPVSTSLVQLLRLGASRARQLVEARIEARVEEDKALGEGKGTMQVMMRLIGTARKELDCMEEAALETTKLANMATRSAYMRSRVGDAEEEARVKATEELSSVEAIQQMPPRIRAEIIYASMALIEASIAQGMSFGIDELLGLARELAARSSGAHKKIEVALDSTQAVASKVEESKSAAVEDILKLIPDLERRSIKAHGDTRAALKRTEFCAATEKAMADVAEARVIELMASLEVSLKKVPEKYIAEVLANLENYYLKQEASPAPAVKSPAGQSGIEGPDYGGKPPRLR